MPRAWPAGPRGHDLDRELRAALRDAEAFRQPPAPGAERQAARPRGGDHRAGGPAQDGHHRDQHGGPRHGHRAWRQRREAVRAHRGGRKARRGRKARARRDPQERMAAAARPRDQGRRAAHHRHRAARVAARRQPAARPVRAAGRPGLVALLPLARGSAAAHLRGRAHQQDHGHAQDARGRGHRAPHGHQLDRKRTAQGRGAQLRHQEAASRVRRRLERPAPDHLPAEERAAGYQGRDGADHGPARRRGDRHLAHARAGRER